MDWSYILSELTRFGYIAGFSWLVLNAALCAIYTVILIGDDEAQQDHQIQNQQHNIQPEHNIQLENMQDLEQFRPEQLQDCQAQPLERYSDKDKSI